MDLSVMCFWILAGASLISGLGLLLTRHPLHGALFLIGVMISLAGLYALLDSPFLGVLQILVYAGAIMMLVVFVIMVLNRAKDDAKRLPDWLGVIGATVPLLFAGLVISVLLPLLKPGADGAQALRVQVPMSYAVSASKGAAVLPAHIERSAAPAYRGEVPAIANALFKVEGGQGYWLLFQLIGVVLLIAIVAAVLLAKRKLDLPVAAEPAADASHDHH